MRFSYSTFFIMNNGNIGCCGSNSNGQLNLGAGAATTQVNVCNISFPNLSKIVSGFAHTFFILSDGTVKCCGKNDYGQLGLGSTATSVYALTSLPLTGIKNIVCSYASTFFLMNDGTVKCCGRNDYGQLGLGNTTATISTVTNLPFTGVKKIVCGLYHTFFIMSDGTVKCCGYNNEGQLGLGYATTSSPYSVSTVTNLPFTGVQDIACGSFFTFFVMNDGTVKCCGGNECGQLGLGNTTSPVSTVTTVSLTGIKKIVCGGATFFVMNDGTIKCCGRNMYGQLGLGNTTSPVSTVTNLPFTGVKKIVLGLDYTFFVMSDGTIKCCGYNYEGELGLGNNTNPIYTVTNLPFSGVIGFADNASTSSILKYLIKDGSDYKTYNNSWQTVSSSPNENDFLNSGMDSIPSTTLLGQLENPELCVYSNDYSSISLKSTLPDIETRYAISVDNSTWYSFMNGEWKIVTDVYKDGMTKSALEAVTQEQFSQIYAVGRLYLKVALKSRNKEITPYVTGVTVDLPQTYATGNYYITTGTNRFNTLDWDKINSITITQTTPSGSDIRYAFSRDERSTWEIYSDGWQKVSLSNLATQGMTKAQVEGITSDQWHTMIWDNEPDKLDVLIYLSSNSNSATPSVDLISFDYDKIITPLDTSDINVPVPEKGYRNVLVNGVYNLKLAQGIAYDDATVDYDFYTTPDRIKLRPLSIGTCIGGKTSPVYVFELINSYESATFDVTLRVSKGGDMAKECGTYALLPDANIDAEKTLVELSLTPEGTFSPAYPLSLRLVPNQKRLIYVRIRPTLTTVGNDTFQIILSGRPV